MTGRLSSLKTLDDTAFGSRSVDASNVFSTEELNEKVFAPMHFCNREGNFEGATRAKQPL